LTDGECRLPRSFQCVCISSFDPNEHSASGL
jgi:hypothetical protein